MHHLTLCAVMALALAGCVEVAAHTGTEAQRAKVPEPEFMSCSAVPAALTAVARNKAALTGMRYVPLVGAIVASAADQRDYELRLRRRAYRCGF